jgi:hypothetical protein
MVHAYVESSGDVLLAMRIGAEGHLGVTGGRVILSRLETGKCVEQAVVSCDAAVPEADSEAARTILKPAFSAPIRASMRSLEPSPYIRAVSSSSWPWLAKMSRISEASVGEKTRDCSLPSSPSVMH